MWRSLVGLPALWERDDLVVGVSPVRAGRRNDPGDLRPEDPLRSVPDHRCPAPGARAQRPSGSRRDHRRGHRRCRGPVPRGAAGSRPSRGPPPPRGGLGKPYGGSYDRALGRLRGAARRTCSWTSPGLVHGLVRFGHAEMAQCGHGAPGWGGSCCFFVGRLIDPRRLLSTERRRTMCTQRGRQQRGSRRCSTESPEGALRLALTLGSTNPLPSHTGATP